MFSLKNAVRSSPDDEMDWILKGIQYVLAIYATYLGLYTLYVKRHCLYSLILLQIIVCTECIRLQEGALTVRFILGRSVEVVGMCLREGDNVATRNPTSSAENWHSSISLQQSGGSV